MRLPRKLKKQLIKVFGRGTYQGILEGILKIDKHSKTIGCHIMYTKHGMINGGTGSRFFHPHQYHPHLTFKPIRNGRQ